MPFDGSGTFAVYTPGTPYVNGTTIDETVVNAVQSDFATGLTNCVTRDGQSPATANLPMGSFRHTGVGNATTRAAATYASARDVQDGTLTYLTGAAGTNTITATAAISMTAYATGQQFCFVPAANNTGATTLNLNSIGAKNVFARGAACAGGEIVSGCPVLVEYDGTQFNILASAGLIYPFGSSLTKQLTKAPTRQVFTSGSGTYTTPTGATRVYVRMIGAGGGGGGSGSGSQTSGGAGGDTTFSTLTAAGGSGGFASTLGSTVGATGGAGTNGDVNITGASGGAAAASASTVPGASGGGTPFGGAGPGGVPGAAGGAGITNSGGGGGGGGGNSGLTVAAAGGGGAGGYVEKLITSPSATYSYAVGAAGTAGSSGTNGAAGGAGGSGLIIVDEFYD